MKNGPGAMNRVYRLVWNESTGAFVAVAESTRGRGKRNSGVMGAVGGALLAAGLLAGGSAWAADPPAAHTLPQGGKLVAGQAGMATNGNRLDITQGSAKAAIDWQSFSIGSGAQVRIQQPDAQSVLLNRVLGADPSAIYGQLSANGQVLLVNPNGIVFGKGSQVDVGGLVASTLDIANADFDAGRYSFRRNGSAGGVLNQGRITAAAGGYVALLAPEVINEGVVAARLGTVALAAGDAVTLDINGSELLGVKVDPATVNALVDNRQLVMAEGGRVILSAGAALRLRERAVAGSAGANTLVEQGGTMRLVTSAGRIEAAAGRVAIEGSSVELGGSVAAGAGRIDVAADSIGQSGVLDASSSAGRGGQITLNAGTVLQTAQAQLRADGGLGGSIRIDAGSRLYSSATFSATGSAGSGGDIAATASSVQLRAATLDASGATGGGRIRVGGGFQGGDADLANARELGVNGTTVLRADASGSTGDGGQVVLWSDDRTVYGGRLSARGGAAGGNGGRAEVSGKGDLTFNGSADLAAPAGQAGRLLLDPRNLIVDNAGNSIAALNLDDPTPSATNGFGTQVQLLTNGNTVITAPNSDTGASTATGAVYLFDTKTGALLANLRGSHAGDHVGAAGVQVLANQNYLVLSPQYGTVSGVNILGLSTTDSNAVPGPSTYPIQLATTASAGAITWQSATGSGSATVGSGNSLVGSTANTESVTRYTYSGNTINNAGSVTITANDQLGKLTTYDMYGSVLVAGSTTITELAGGNVAIAAPNWFDGRGAVAWMDGSTGALANAAAGGAVSSSTALVGSTGIRTQAVVSTDSAKKVYVIGVDSALPYTYTQGATNRRNAPPGGAGDAVGQSITALPGGGYVIASPTWSNGGTAYAGAVSYGAAGGTVGTVSSSNSLVGSHAYDFVGSGGVSVVGGANYVVASPYWSDSGNAATGRYLLNNPNGAVTWVDGSNGNVFGAGSAGAVVSSTNSLNGSAGSMLGSRDTYTNTPYTSYDYNTSYVLTTTSSTRAQASGTGGVTLLKNGSYLVLANAWNGSMGSVTFGSGSAGVAGAVSSSNSLVGSASGDAYGNSVVELSGSNYLVVAPYSDLGASDGGAVTWGSGTAGVAGAVSTSNSLYGNQAGARVGSGGALPVGTADGQQLRPNAIVLSPQWGNRAAATSIVAYGAVTWVDGSNGRAYGQGGTGAAVASGNSLVGSSAADYVGSIHTADTRGSSYVGDGSSLYQVTGAWDAVLTASVDVLANGDYLVRSPNWGGGKGAVSWGAGASGLAGAVSSSNSLVGSVADVISTATATQTRAGMSFTDTTYRLTTTGDHVGLLGQGLANGNYLAISPYWNGGRGAITWIGSGNRTGTVSASNSLVGSTPDTYGDVNHGSITATGDRLGTVPSTNWVVPVISDATVSGQTYTTSTTRPTGPYSFGSSYAIVTASWYSGGGNVTLGRSYSNPSGPQKLLLDNSWGYLTTNFNYNGTPIVQQLANGNVLVASPGWNNGAATRAGAVSWIDGSTGALVGGGAGGTLGSSNSLVGSHSDDVLGFRLPVDGFAQLTNGNFLLINPQWNAERGAITWGSGTAGVTGTVSSANSLVGSTGSGSLGFVTASDYVYRIVDARATLNGDWIDRSSDLTGDRIGIAGVTVLPDGNAVVNSPLWSQSSAWTQYAQPSSLGAATWINGSNGRLIDGSAGGAVSATNSLVGSQAGDAVGYNAWVDPNSGMHYVAGGVTALSGGRYAVASPWWNNGAAAEAGAVSFGAAGGIAGVVSTSNSLVGATAGDHVGRSLSSLDLYTYGAKLDAGVVVLDTGSAKNYLVRSTDWSNGFATSGAGAGAVTWVDGSNGHAHGESGAGAAVGAGNSLVGNTAGDGVGSQIIALTRNVSGTQVASGDMLVLSNVDLCGNAGFGAITLVSGAQGGAGPISWRNSVLGLAAASDGLQTTGFDGWSYSTDIHATLLPTAVTAAEQVAYRPLVWVAPNAGSGNNASRAMVLTLVADNAAAPVSADQVNGTAGNLNWTGSLFAADGSGYAALGASAGLLGFAASTGSDAVITPAAITSMLNAGTAVTLQASNDITVLRDITASAGGHGGDLTLEAGRSIYIRANIDTDGGHFAARANQSSGVVDADCSVCAAVITQQAGTTVRAGAGNAAFVIDESSSKTYNDAGTLRLASVDAAQVYASNAGLNGSSVGQGLRFQPGAVLGNSGTVYLTLQARGTSATGGGIVLAADTQLNGWGGGVMFVGPSRSDIATTFGGSSSTGLAMTAAEMGALIRQSTGFGGIEYGANSSAATTIGTVDFTQATMHRPGESQVSLQLGFQGGSGGLNLTGGFTSGSSGDNGIELATWSGTLSLASTSSVTASTGILSFVAYGSSAVTQTAGSTLNVSRLVLGGQGSVNLVNGNNTIGTLGGSVGSAQVKTSSGNLTIGQVGGNAGLTVSTGAELQASGASADLVLDKPLTTSSGSLVLAAGRNFVNNNAADTGLVTGSGRYLVYSASPSASTEGMSSYSKHYAQSYSSGSTPGYAGSGNWFLYSVAPTLTVGAGSGSTVIYGASASAPAVGISGFIDGDTAGTATTGSLSSSLSSYTPSGAGYIPAGSYTLTLTGQGTFASPMGYAISVTTGSSTLTVQPKAINVSGLSANNKVYDGTTTTSVSGSASLQGGGSTSGDGKAMSGDTVSVSGTATGAFADRHAGTGKSVTLSGLTLAGGDAGNYTISAGSVTADITPKALDASGLSVAASRAYNGGLSATVIGSAALRSAEAAGTGSTSDGKPYSLDTVSITGTATATYDAATVAGASSVAFGGLTLAGAQAGNYTLSLGSQAATITPKTLTVSGVTAQNKVYDASATASFSGTAALSGVVGSDAVSLSGTLAGSFADANVANGKTVSTSGLSLGGGDAGNYSLGAFSPTANITARGITVTATDQNKTYGGTDPTLAYTIGGLGLAGSDSVGSVFSGALGTATGASATAGTHAISQGTLAVSSGNYSLSGFTGGTLTVGKATLNVSADDKSKTYGGSDPALTYTVNASQLKYTDTASVVSGVSLSTSTGAAATAGAHAITATGGTASNYDLVLADGTLTVGKATLNVMADDKAKTYGGSDPALSYTVNAAQLKYTDTASVVSGVALATTTGAAATAGTHAITATGGTASNYDLVLADGTFTVGKATLNVTADDKAKTYGGSDPALSYTVNAAQLKYTDTASVVSGVSLATSTGAAATAGTHAITATGGTASNYDLVLADGTLTVGKATLNVTADDKAKTYGGSDPALSYTVNAAQLKYTDTASVVSGVALATTTGAAATAGTHAITATGGTASNYDLVLADGTLTVGKATLNVTADDKAKTYGGSDPALSYTVNAAQLKYTDTASVVSGVNLSTTTGAAATAGTHAISATGGTASNYNLVLADGRLTVGKATLNVTADDKTKTYGGSDPALSYSVNAAQLKYTDTASVVSGVSLSTTTGAAATAGAHAISASGGTASNYNLVLADGTLTVGKATLNVTADDKAKTYGGSDPALSYTVNAAQLKYTDTASVVSGVNLSTTTGAAATAGTHAISATGGTASNYTLVLADGTLTVGKATLNVTADNQAKTYGDADPALSYTVNAAQLKYTDTAGVVSGVNLATTTGAAATAGSHAISASGGTAANYQLVLADGTLSVGKATLNVRADNQAKTYGDADPALSYSVNAAQLKYTDTASVVSGVNLATSTGAAATAGSHVIAATGGSASNYTLVLADGTLAVAKAALNVTADNQAKTYGDADPALSYTVNAAQLKYTDTAAVVSGVSLSAPTGAAATAGAHAISASGGTASNYQLVLADGVLTVGKATLNVGADNKAKTYGDADPALTYTVNASQLKYTDTAGVVSGVNLGAPTGAAAAAGTHTISATGGTASNYQLVLADGILAVSKATLNVTADNQAKTYGDADPALSYSVNAAQLKYTDTAAVVSGVNLATATGAAATAGTHAINASGGTAANYQLVLADGILAVAKAALTVSADNQAKTYGDADPTLGYTVNAAQLKYGDTAGVVSGIGLATATGAAATAGTHVIAATGGTAANYVVQPVDGTLTVARALLNVSADNQAKTYGDADPALAYTVNAAQLKYTDTAAVVSGVNLATATGAAATAGTHAIAASGGTASNYALVLADGTLTVAKAALNVSADDKAKTYGDADPTLGYTVNATQLKYGDGAGVVSGIGLATATGAAATAGTHAIAISGGAADNYAITLTPGTLTVAKAALTVTADDKSKTGGERDPALSYTVDAAQLKYTDTAAVVSGVQLSAPTGAGLPPGDYAIVAADGSADNYALRYVDGRYTVKPSPSVKAENLSSQLAPVSAPASGTLPVPPSVAAPAPSAGQPGTVVVIGGGVAGAPAPAFAPVSAPVAAPAPAPVSAATPVPAAVPAPAVAPEPAAVSVPASVPPAGSGPATAPAVSPTASPATSPAAAPAANSAGSPAATPATSPAAPAAGEPAAVPAAAPAPAPAPAPAAAPAPAPRLLTVQPETRVTAEPARDFRFDASTSFERPPQAKIAYAARLADGRPLPAWLAIDSASGVLAGTPPEGAAPVMEVIVTAQQEGGPTATTRVTVRVAR